jgi:hypothetical protein
MIEFTRAPPAREARHGTGHSRKTCQNIEAVCRNMARSWGRHRAAGKLRQKAGELPQLEHDPEKWKPVFRKDHAQTKRCDHDSILSNRIMI